MYFKVEKFREIIFLEKKKEIKINGYSFIDINNRCICIVYGEGKRDSLIKYLTE